MRPPHWLLRGTGGDHRTTLLRPSAVMEGWLTGDGFAWHDGAHLFVPAARRVAALAFDRPEALITRGSSWVAWDVRGRSVRWNGRILTVSPVPVRLDVELKRTPEGWACDHTHLPWGARRSRCIAPFATGMGLVWIDGPWVQRWRPDQGIRCIGAIDPAESIVVGPQGAVLIGDDRRFTRCAAPRRSARPLGRSLERWPAPRWSTEGVHVAGMVACDAVVAVRVNLTTGQAEHLGTDVTPVDTVSLLQTDGDGQMRVGDRMIRPAGLPDGRHWDGIAEGGERVTGTWSELLDWRANGFAWSEDGLLVAPGR